MAYTRVDFMDSNGQLVAFGREGVLYAMTGWFPYTTFQITPSMLGRAITTLFAFSLLTTLPLNLIAYFRKMLHFRMTAKAL